MRYLSLSDEDRRKILQVIGINDIDELFQQAGVKGSIEIGLGEKMSEPAVWSHFERLQSMCNDELVCFLGGGAYDHYIPRVIDHIIGRVEFYSSYTPYQPELSQGTLQSIYEYQTMVSKLTGMEVSNASMYDGATALAEAILMAQRIKGKRTKVLLPETLNPLYKKVVNTYTSGMELEKVWIPFNGETGYIDVDSLSEHLDENVLCCVFQSPNFFGIIERDMEELIEVIHQSGGLAIVSTNPISLGLLRAPGDMGADIVVCEGQPLGLSLSFGGPYLGVFASRREYIRRMPGRLIARTVDVNGRRGFVMTLQAREQHIRREKATSNICTNQQLCALATAVYMATLGDGGIREVARQSFAKTEYLKKELKRAGFSLPYSGITFNEFVVDLGKKAKKVVDVALNSPYAVGIALSDYMDGVENHLLVAVTEKRTKVEMDKMVSILKEA